MTGIFGKVTSAKFKLNLGGPAGGSALERASPPKNGKYYMTRRAFLSSRVIQAQGKFDSNMLVKNLESLVSKTRISQNL